MLSAKHGIIACQEPGSKLLQVCHLETGECLTVLENAPNLQYKYLLGVIYYTTESFTLCATSLRDGETLNLTGHTDWITDFMVTPDFACSAAADKTCIVWTLGDQPAKNRRKVVLSGHKKAVQCVQMRTGLVLLSGSSDHTIKQWNRETGACLGTLIGHEGPVRVLCVVNFDTLYSGSEDGTVRMWDLNSPSQRALKVFNVGSPLTSVRVNTSQRHMVAVSKEAVFGFSLPSGARTGLHVQTQAHGKVNSMTLYDERLVTGTEDAAVRVWQLEDGQCVLIGDAHTDSVTCVEVADGALYVFRCFSSSFLFICSMILFLCLFLLIFLTLLPSTAFHSFTYYYNSYSASMDGSVRAWQLEPSARVPSVREDRTESIAGAPHPDDMSGLVTKLLAGHLYTYAETEYRKLARIDSSAAIDLRVDSAVFPAVLDMYRFESSVMYQMLATELLLAKLVPLIDSADVKALALSFNSLGHAHKSFVRELREALQAWGPTSSMAHLYTTTFVPLHRYEEFISCFLLALPYFRVNQHERPFLDRLRQADVSLGQLLAALMLPVVELFRRKVCT